MKKTNKKPSKDVNQLAKSAVDLSIDILNKAADTYQSEKEKSKKIG
jgi:hypothetical protein